MWDAFMMVNHGKVPECSKQVPEILSLDTLELIKRYYMLETPVHLKLPLGENVSVRTISRKGIMLNVKNIAWLAGIIDGEGCFTTNTRNGVNSRKDAFGAQQNSFVTRMQIGNTDMAIIKRVSEILFGLGIKYYYGLHPNNKRFVNSMPYLTINVEGYRSVKKLVEAILPFMCDGNKKKQASLTLEYILYRQDEPIKGSYDRDEKFVCELKRLKREQIPPSTTKRIASTPLEW